MSQITKHISVYMFFCWQVGEIVLYECGIDLVFPSHPTSWFITTKKILRLRWNKLSSGDCLRHTQGIIPDQPRNVALENSGMFQAQTAGRRSSVPHRLRITWILVKIEIEKKNAPLENRLTFLWSSCLDSRGSTSRTPTKLRRVSLSVRRPTEVHLVTTGWR